MQIQHSSIWLCGLVLCFLFGMGTLAQAQHTPTGYAPDRVLIAFEPGTLGAEKKSLHAKVGASVLHSIPGIGVDVVQVPAGTVLAKIKLYDKNPNVRYAEPDSYRVFWFPQEGAEPFSTNMFDEQWALHNTGQTITGCDPFFGCIPFIVGTPNADINAPEAWDIGRSHADIRIAIMDSGVDKTSLDLDGKYLAAEERNFVVSYENTLEDLTGHGTHVAGTAAAECNNNEGVSGVACEASVVSLKVCFRYENPDNIFDPLNGAGVCPLSAVADAIVHTADPNEDGDMSDHFDVVNMSFGTDIVENGVWQGLLGHSPTEEAAINLAFDAGVLLVAAAGNDGTSQQLYPAGYDNVIAVGATDEDDFKASFSNYGTNWVSVGAPGNYIWSSLPNALCGLDSSNPGSVCLGPNSGTSMASPHVAGAAAVVLGYLRDEYAAGRLPQPPTNAQVRCHIEQGADQSGVQGLDYSVLYFQYGRLNLVGALQYLAVCDGSLNNTPAAPSGLTAANSYIGKGKNKAFNGVQLNWTNNANNAQTNLLQRCDNVTVSGRKRHRVYTCATENDWYTLAHGMPANQSAYFDGVPSTATNTTYLYRVQTNNAVGPSPWSNEVGITTPRK
jgi:subtilisin family serine protease